MKRYVVGLTFRYIESNHDTYQVITEKELEEFKKDIFKGILEVRKKYNFAKNLMRKIEIEDAANGYNL